MTQVPLPTLPDQLYFRIGEVAKLVGVEAHVLRYWEGEFGFEPHRSPRGQRLYTKEDISNFLEIRQLLHEQGYTVAGARNLMERSDNPERSPAGPSSETLNHAKAELDRVRAKLADIRRKVELAGIS